MCKWTLLLADLGPAGLMHNASTCQITGSVVLYPFHYSLGTLLLVGRVSGDSMH